MNIDSLDKQLPMVSGSSGFDRKTVPRRKLR